MPAIISKGIRVSASVGPLHKAGKRRKRSVFHGTVLGSAGEVDGDRIWRVHWDEIGMTSDHKFRGLHVMKNTSLQERLSDDLLSLLQKNSEHIGSHGDLLAYTANGIRSTVQSSNHGMINQSAGVTTNHEANPNGAGSVNDIDDSGPPGTTTIVNTPTADDSQSVSTMSAGQSSEPPSIPDQTNETLETSTGNGIERPTVLSTHTETGPNLDDEDDPDDELEEIAIEEREIEAELRQEEQTNRHQERMQIYLNEKEKLIADNTDVIVKGPAQNETHWKVMGDVLKKDVVPMKEFHKCLGVKGFDFSKENRTVNCSKVMTADGKFIEQVHKNDRCNFLDLFIHMFGDGDGEGSLCCCLRFSLLLDDIMNL